MEAHLQRLRDYLSRSGLTPTEARDGMVSAYLVISRLNQLQGNPDVGLKQDEQGLMAHISGFMGAVFWERGFNFDAPTIQNLSEIKMMLDGMSQVYAMPDNLQMALNEMCDVLLARGRGEPAMVSPAVMDLLQVQVNEELQAPEPPAAPAAPRAAEPDLDLMPDEPAAESASEPAPAAESAPEERPWYATSQAFTPPTPAETAEFELSRLEVTQDRPDEPGREEPHPVFETPAEAPAPEPAEKPAKKKSSRKKAAPAEGEPADAAAPKPARKRAAKSKAPAAEPEPMLTPGSAEFAVPDDYMRIESEPAPRAAAPDTEDRFGVYTQPEPEPAAEPAYAAPEPAPEAEPAPEPFYQAPEPAAEPAPEPEPAPAAFPDAEPEPARPRVELDLPAHDAPPARRSGGHGGGLVLGLILGLLLGAGGLFAYHYFLLKPAADKRLDELTAQAASLQTQLSAAAAEKEKLERAATEQTAAWKSAPGKPEALRAGAGVVLAWADPVARRYVLYRAKGEKGELAKVQPDPLAHNWFALPKPESGVWRFAVAALDAEGQETPKSEELKVKLPIPK